MSLLWCSGLLALICMSLAHVEWVMIQRHQRQTVMAKSMEFKVYM